MQSELSRRTFAIAACVLPLVFPKALLADQTLSITPQVLQRLRDLKLHLTFEADEAAGYTGVFDPRYRLESDRAFAHLVDLLVAQLPRKPSKDFVLGKFKLTWQGLPLFDTEDRERAIGYFEKIMDVLGIKSSDGVLNRLLYGPLLGRMVGSKIR